MRFSAGQAVLNLNKLMLGQHFFGRKHVAPGATLQLHVASDRVLINVFLLGVVDPHQGLDRTRSHVARLG